MAYQSMLTPLEGVKIIYPNLIGDSRGLFFEAYQKSELVAVGIIDDFIQDNHSISEEVGTIRGLHFQTTPFAQAKLVRVPVGAIYDVVVDIRVGSPTFGHHFGVVLTAMAMNMLYVPAGFAHGLCTLLPNTHVVYKVTAPYAPANDAGLLWSDPAIGIPWPINFRQAILSDKDKKHPPLSELRPCFRY